MGREIFNNKTAEVYKDPVFSFGRET